MKKTLPIFRFIQRMVQKQSNKAESPLEIETSESNFARALDGIDQAPVVADNELLDSVIPKSEPVSLVTDLSLSGTIEKFFAESQSASEPTVVLGVDLGTSFSKVVRRLGTDDVRPVCFGANPLSLSDYLLPSLVTLKNGTILSGFDADASSEASISNFKMCLACESDVDRECGTANCPLTSWHLNLFPDSAKGRETEFVSALFLADLIVKTKTAISGELQRKFGRDVNPKWTANFAVPDSFIEQSGIAVVFRRVFRTAWIMAGIFLLVPIERKCERIWECFNAARDFSEQSLEVLSDEEFGCSPYPEIGAEVASIVMSKTSETGLYAFVDVGAGTVDASVFRYYRDGAKAKRPPYAATISNAIGAAQIEIRASAQSGYPVDGYSVQHLKTVKETYKLLDQAEQVRFRGELQFLKRSASVLRKQTADHLKTVLSDAFEKELDLNRWQDLRLVLGGGGANLACYQKAAVSGFSLHQNNEIKPPDTTMTLPLPHDFDLRGLPLSDYLRFAVAYGLSYPISQLPDPDFCKDVKPLAKPKLRIRNYGDYYEK